MADHDEQWEQQKDLTASRIQSMRDDPDDLASDEAYLNRLWKE